MTFVDRLRPELICIEPPWRSFATTARGLIELLADARAVPRDAVDAAVRAVTDREAVESTALLDVGSGVPHARLPGLDHTVVALAVASDGLYEAVPTVPIRIVALVLSPPTAVDDHLRMLAGIATLLRSPALRAALVGAPDAATALSVLRAYGAGAP
ncbi:MAG: PTS sugar transporter subunit IIA [Candidatus Binatia bacterium]